MKKIDCIIVTYNPDKDIINIIKKLKNDKNIRNIYIIDNNSAHKKELKKLEREEKILLKYNSQNLGLAKAQNLGIELSLKNKSEWILFLDDDSKIDENMLDKMLVYENKKKVGIIAPNILFDNKKKINYPVKKRIIKREKFKEKKIIENILFAIASGSLIKSNIFREIGLFKENYFIDHIDIEFCLRVNMAGYKILAVKEAFLYQRVGNTEEKKILKFKVHPTNHNPKRQFTKYRNAIWFWKEYFLKEPIYICYDVLIMLNNFIRILCFEKEKKIKLQNVFKGIYFGIINRG